MSQPLPPIIEKLLRNAHYCINPNTGNEVMVLRCEAHGPCTDPFRATSAECVECQTICAWIRQEILTEDPTADPLGDKHEALNRAVANAAQAERAGDLDLEFYPHAILGRNLKVKRDSKLIQ